MGIRKCDQCKRPMFNSENTVTGTGELEIFVHKMCEDKWYANHKEVIRYKFFTSKDKCIKCGDSLRHKSTFCHDCGKCGNCLTKKCKKVVILGADE